MTQQYKLEMIVTVENNAPLTEDQVGDELSAILENGQRFLHRMCRIPTTRQYRGNMTSLAPYTPRPAEGK